MAIKVNDDVGNYFQTRKGLRQGDPASPILFNIVADMLATLIERAKSVGQITGVIPHLVEGGLSILQYADDTILFLDRDLEKARNLKLLLCAFEDLSGLKINLHKSELFCFGEAAETSQEYADIFGCQIGHFPMKYLGLPLSVKRLKRIHFQPLEDKIAAQLTPWMGKHVAAPGRMVLVKSVITAIAIYYMTALNLPVEVLKKIDAL